MSAQESPLCLSFPPLNKRFNVIMRQYHMAMSHSSLKNFPDVWWMVLFEFYLNFPQTLMYFGPELLDVCKVNLHVLSPRNDLEYRRRSSLRFAYQVTPLDLSQL